MHEIIGPIVGLSVFVQVMLGLVIAAALPLLYVWMFVDAVLRDEREYPSSSSNEKLMWVLLIVFVHVSAVLYFFLVFRKVKRGSVPLQYGAVAPVA